MPFISLSSANFKCFKGTATKTPCLILGDTESLENVHVNIYYDFKKKTFVHKATQMLEVDKYYKGIKIKCKINKGFQVKHYNPHCPHSFFFHTGQDVNHSLALRALFMCFLTMRMIYCLY